MAKLLVHIHSHPGMKNKVTLGLLVAVSGLKEGHQVEIFLAGDGVHLLNCKDQGEVVGQGAGDVNRIWMPLRKQGLKFLFLVCLLKHEDTMMSYFRDTMRNLRCQMF